MSKYFEEYGPELTDLFVSMANDYCDNEPHESCTECVFNLDEDMCVCTFVDELYAKWHNTIGDKDELLFERLTDDMVDHYMNKVHYICAEAEPSDCENCQFKLIDDVCMVGLAYELYRKWKNVKGV